MYLMRMHLHHYFNLLDFTVLLRTLALFMTNFYSPLFALLPSLGFPTRQPSLHLPTCTFWYTFKNSLSHPCLICSDHTPQPLQPSPALRIIIILYFFFLQFLTKNVLYEMYKLVEGLCYKLEGRGLDSQ
jgi:hypothetical protein